MNVCIYCTMEICFQCEDPRSDEACCCGGAYGYATLANLMDEPKSKKQKLEGESGIVNKVGRPKLNASEMRDPVGSGRARAEDLAPIPADYLCEWTLLSKAGGGPIPIIGCAGNTATARHHGPDKSTLNNTVGINLHRICAVCHNRWHALNDPFYGERPSDNLDYWPLDSSKVPHDRLSRATPDQIIKSESWWRMNQETRGEYRSWEKNLVESTSKS